MFDTQKNNLTIGIKAHFYKAIMKNKRTSRLTTKGKLNRHSVEFNSWTEFWCLTYDLFMEFEGWVDPLCDALVNFCYWNWHFHIDPASNDGYLNFWSDGVDW